MQQETATSRASSVTSAILEGDLMRNIHCLNNISAYGTDLLTDDY